MRTASDCIHHPGLHLVHRPKYKSLLRCRHYAVVVVCVGQAPVLYEHGPRKARCLGIPDLSVPLSQWIWETSCGVSTPALLRLEEMLSAGLSYRLFRMNCEHFARYIVEGRRESEQVNEAGEIALTVIEGITIMIRELAVAYHKQAVAAQHRDG